MPRLPRDLSGLELCQALEALGYKQTRQSGAHIRLTTLENGEHHITIPAHKPLKVGTLNRIIGELSGHFGVEKSELVMKLFGNI